MTSRSAAAPGTSTGPLPPSDAQRVPHSNPVAARQLPARFAVLVVGSLAMIFLCGVAGLFLGSHRIDPSEVWSSFTAYDAQNNAHVIVRSSRLPRAVLGIVVGSALGLAGALMQSLTRNPLADPGILGVNAGAAAAVVVAIAYLGASNIGGYIWAAFGGAGLAAVAVYLLGSSRKSSATPIRMALAGSAVTIAITAVTNMVLISNEPAFNSFRYWAVGSLQGRGLEISASVAPFILGGILLSLLLAGRLNAMALGEETARGLGVRTGSSRMLAAIAVVLCAGAATAAAGPIGFVGLAAPHMVRRVVGADHRLLLPGVVVAAPAFLLCADVLGRVLVAPGELQTGIAATALGGPLFVWLVRSRKLGQR